MRTHKSPILFLFLTPNNAPFDGPGAALIHLSSSTVVPPFILTASVAVLSFCQCVWWLIEITCATGGECAGMRCAQGCGVTGRLNGAPARGACKRVQRRTWLRCREGVGVPGS